MSRSVETRETPPRKSSKRASKKRAGKKRAGLTLEVLDSRFAICRLEPGDDLPAWALGGEFFAVAKSAEELSVVCDENAVPRALSRNRRVAELGWRALKVRGPLEFSLVGILASLSVPLARARITLFAVSTFDTDYLLVRDKKLTKALEALAAAGHRIATAPRKPPVEIEEKPESEEQAAPLLDDGSEGEKPRALEPRREKARSPRARRGKRRRDEAEVEEAAGVERSPEREERKKRSAKPKSEEEPRRKRSAKPKSEEEPRKRKEKSAKGEEPRRRRKTRERETQEREPVREHRDARSRRGDVPEEIDTRGLATGAIPQEDVATTDEPFSALGLDEDLLGTITRLGFRHPTPIQAQAIPPALEGRDVVGLAETGSGKTAAFGLPLANKLTHGKGIRGLILSPTREIALQTKAFLEIFGRDHDLETVAVIGGVRMGPQINGLKRHPDIIVATPGRLADHMRRRNVRLDKIEHLVIDEADHMLDLGFLPQIKEILVEVPDERQTMMFSATMPPPIESLTRTFMNDPVRIDLRPEGRVAAGIEHRLYLVKDEDGRKECLHQLVQEVPGTTLVFVRRKIRTEWLARQLELEGLPVARIHSDRSQGQRVDALRGFREGQHQILVATDVAARGIDVPSIEHVINFGLPETVEDYIHRAGRTARGSAEGIVSSIATWQDLETVRDIELALGKKLPRHTIEGVEPYVELRPRGKRRVRRRRLL